jgi:hypothetical protein
LLLRCDCSARNVAKPSLSRGCKSSDIALAWYLSCPGWPTLVPFCSQTSTGNRSGRGRIAIEQMRTIHVDTLAGVTTRLRETEQGRPRQSLTNDDRL